MTVLRLILAALVLAAAGCGRGPTTASLPDLKLPTYGGKVSDSLASCPTAKCLTVVVAPWCGYCRAGTPVMLRLRPWLAERGVAMRFVVGLAELESVKEYAQEIGPEAMLDPRGLLRVGGGVPHFFVSDPSGAVIKETSGMPMTEDVTVLARAFGLP